MNERQIVPLHVLDAEAEPSDSGWEDVYRNHVVGIYRFVFSRCGNRPDAEDLTAQVFLRALPRLRGDVSAGEVHAYLVTTAKTVLADFWRESYGVVSTESDFDIPARPHEPHADRSAEVDALLERLSERQRQTLELRFLRGYSIRETAQELGMSISNVKVTQLRALRRAAGLAEESS